MKPRFFAGPDEFRDWLEAHHSTEKELLVGFYKKHTGRRSMSWEEAVREALCFGWIDGLTRRIDEDSYCIRFTPRKPRSNWSAVNVRHVEELLSAGRMRPAGIAAFEARTQEKTGIYTYENRHAAKLGPEQDEQFRANERAWQFFQAQPPSYRRLICNYVMSAKKDETRRRRLDRIITVSSAQKRLNLLAPGKEA
jgi:uncharacterized protein YdeI (YjbR/CyaY-like superfamily)